MSFSASVQSSPIVLIDPSEEGVARFEAIAAQVLDDYFDNFDLEENQNGSLSFQMLDSHDVGDSFNERLDHLAKEIGPLLAKPCCWTLVDLDTGSDDERKSYCYAGATPQAVEKLRQFDALDVAAEAIRRASLPDILSVIEAKLQALKPWSTDSWAPIEYPLAPATPEHPGNVNRYFKTLIAVEVISEDEPHDGSLISLYDDINSGDCSGLVLSTDVSELTPDQARKALQAQGSGADFFQSLAEDEDVEDGEEKGPTA